MIRRKQIALDRLPDKTAASLRRLSDPDLFTFISGWKDGSADWIAGQVELRRRESWASRWALGVSIVALITSFVALAVKIVAD